LFPDVSAGSSLAGDWAMMTMTLEFSFIDFFTAELYALYPTPHNCNQTEQNYSTRKNKQS
jgi:hypothetical protein